VDQSYELDYTYATMSLKDNEQAKYL